jgi:hypothetical protein
LTGEDGMCSQECPSGTGDYFKYQCQEKSIFIATTDGDLIADKLIKYKLMKEGPMHMTFGVTESFKNYKSGVFKKLPSEEILGYETAMLVGWGKERDGTLFWKL